jgi:hypothetical protein
VLELVDTFVFALTLETLIGRRASGLFTSTLNSDCTQELPRKLLPTRAQRAPKPLTSESAN